MTREEIKDELYRMLSDVVNGSCPIRNNTQRDRYREAVKEVIEVLEQDTVPFDFELYQAGLMDMPEEMIKVLDKIRAEIMDFEEELFHRPNTDYTDYAAVRHCVEIIDKYKAESEDKE